MLGKNGNDWDNGSSLGCGYRSEPGYIQYIYICIYVYINQYERERERQRQRHGERMRERAREGEQERERAVCELTCVYIYIYIYMYVYVHLSIQIFAQIHECMHLMLLWTSPSHRHWMLRGLNKPANYGGFWCLVYGLHEDTKWALLSQLSIPAKIPLSSKLTWKWRGASDQSAILYVEPVPRPS